MIFKTYITLESGVPTCSNIISEWPLVFVVIEHPEKCCRNSSSTSTVWAVLFELQLASSPKHASHLDPFNPMSPSVTTLLSHNETVELEDKGDHFAEASCPAQVLLSPTQEKRTIQSDSPEASENDAKDHPYKARAVQSEN